MGNLSENLGLLIDGKMAAGAKSIEVINPATGAPFISAPAASVDQANEAVAAANAAYPGWAAKPISERAAALVAVADALKANAEELSRALTLEQGKPAAEAGAEIAYTEAFFRYFATLDLPVEVRVDDEAKRVEIHRNPLGVVVAIIPWNFPLLIVSFKIPLALLAGNTVIIKPSPTTPVTTLMFGKLCQDIFPKGVVNIISDENDLGPVLTAHPDVAKVSFTGSTETGKKVMQSAANTLKRLTLELGGNDPGIVLDDVNVPETAAKLFGAAFMNCGQVCLALKRAYVHESIYDEMCDELASLAKNAVVDDGLQQGTQIGPMQNQMQYEKVKGFLDDSKAAGNIIAGGNAMDRDGYFIEPTIVRDVSDGDRIVDEEQFGPILPVISYSDIDDVIDRANNTPYGLGGSVWSSDIERAKGVAEKVDSGTVWVNTHLDFGPNIPFGGAKQSGIGTEFGQEGLEEFTQLKVINIAK